MGDISNLSLFIIHVNVKTVNTWLGFSVPSWFARYGVSKALSDLRMAGFSGVALSPTWYPASLAKAVKHKLARVLDTC